MSLVCLLLWQKMVFLPIIVGNIRTGLEHLTEINCDFRFCRKRKFLLYHVKLVSGHTATWKLILRSACAAQVTLREELIHANKTVEDR